MARMAKGQGGTMKFRSETTIAHPRDDVFAAYRDHLSGVVAFLEDIKEVNVLSRSEEGSMVTLHNEWVSDREVPKMAAAMITSDQLKWDDYAKWDGSTYTCAFQIKTRVFTDSVRCTGKNTFISDPAGTRVVLEGEFEMALTSLPGVPKFVAKRMVPKVEEFIVSLITPNLEKTSAAVGRFLDSKKG